MKPVIVLASASEIRAKILRDAGVEFEIHPADVDEDALKTRFTEEGASIEVVASRLAETKAVAVSRDRPEAVVVGSDQILRFNGDAFDKAVDITEARGRLQMMRGRVHELIGATAIAREGAVRDIHLETTRLTMRDASDAFIDGYLEAEGADLLKSVGCYRVEGCGVQLFERIEGDIFAVLGLALLPVLAMLRAEGALDT